MIYRLVVLLIPLLFLQLHCTSTSEKTPVTEIETDIDSNEHFVILKLDDLWYKGGEIHTGWLQVMDFLNSEQVVGTIGIVGSSLEDGDASYFDWIKARHAEGHEIWHHGFCHCRYNEGDVQIREYEREEKEQEESLLKTQRLAKEKLGITLRSFGAPYNATDQMTARILNQLPDLKVWMYKDTNAETNKFVLSRIPAVNIEYPVHQPDFAAFKEGYEQHKDAEILTIQGHPRSWVDEPERFEEFKRIIYFLKAEGITFITPYEYFLRK